MRKGLLVEETLSIFQTVRILEKWTSTAGNFSIRHYHKINKVMKTV